ncbi:aminotransferase class V-fold PLP-dependent enzyme [Haloechinothrix sp. LS1_15]|uniref:pyridoxal phosphate-dependent decarboxylase family protein n=1 Tax=Haloechinothrix sp. LS1_15 TaxID=2652248 RepID=UPI0029449079|nr:aminotransferase class V-fold PLP-dependent enzyme [Haloechinothrix sp. LS1_15]MDV6013771.1 aspartate aminotransferase family protein [Haloechinothrix sp. LS1_15]
MTELRPALQRAADLAFGYLEGSRDRPVARRVAAPELREGLGGPLPENPSDPTEVVEALARAAEPGLVVTNAGRYFGFVEGGVVPASMAADWLTSAWDQNPAFSALSPAAAVAEEVCRGWLCELLGLPAGCSAGFTSGAQLANLAGLAAGRHHVLREAGWDVDADGLFGAPEVTVVVSAGRHATIDRALRFLGLGERRVTVVPADDQGRMRPDALGEALVGGPTIVCAQAGNVNTGAVDPLREIAEHVRECGAWLHVDGAFGLWAAAAPSLKHLTEGAELADSWAVDGHKWLNVPYDCGIVLCAHPESHRSAMALTAPYLTRTSFRDGSDWSPESSRRARVFPLWAALRSLGRTGVAALVERCCAHARRIADTLAADPRVEVLNDVVLNQVLVRIGDDERTRAAAEQVQAAGSTWFGTTAWQGRAAIRISVSDHATTTAHADGAAEALLRAARD